MEDWDFKFYRLDLKFQSSCEFCIIYFGWFFGVCILCADVSEHRVWYVFIGGGNKKSNRDEIVWVFIQVKGTAINRYLYM